MTAAPLPSTDGQSGVRHAGAGALKAPFPYFGGKSAVATTIWDAFGDPPNYVEPFAGSLAVLLQRPTPAKIETVNDIDGYVANVWRAIQADPEAVAAYADWPVSEVDLHARHAWLLGQRDRLTERLVADPDYFDAKIAGWWVWGACCWIGAGWCRGDGPWHVVDGALTNVGDAGQGIHRQLPRLGDAGRGIADYLAELAERLRRVRICCGDWSRICGPTPTTKHGVTAVLLDPPYALDGRTPDLYTHETDVFEDVRHWAIEHGDDPMLRIAFCGYDGPPMPPNWRVYRWKAPGGYGNQGTGVGRENARREIVWFSPHCLVRQRTLFEAQEATS